MPETSGASFVIWSTSTHNLASADDAAGGRRPAI
jgi:hypothetical protein